MGGKCSPSGGINPIQDGNLTNIKDPHGDPNSRTDLYDDNSDIVQSRWYDENGWAVWDRDYQHNDSNNTHAFPHDHSWFWKWNEAKGRYTSDRPEEQLNQNYC